MNTQPPNEESILEQALTFTAAAERLAYLQGACGGDQQLRARVLSLIQAHQAAGGFLADRAPTVEATATVEVPPEESPGMVIGRYKLLQRIGEGGCGVVYMAEQEEPVRRRVALKVIKLGMDSRQVVARFEAERQALALMDHPNIAKVFDAGTSNTGRPFFVMELVKGIRITDYCDQNNLPTRARLLLFVQVCHAIQHAHQKGIIHRDIKPSNILVTLHDGVPMPKVIDFGIAKATEQRLTEKTLFTAFEQIIGTPAYMSPEQAEMSGMDIDTRSDIYALGVLLYELLTGKTPFDAKRLLAAGLDEMRRIIREQEPIRPSTCLSTMLAGEMTVAAKHRQSEPPRLIQLVRGDLDWIVMKALEKDRTRRYETATGLAQDIGRHMDNEPVVARPPSTAYRIEKAWRRHKVAFAAGTVVAASLVIGTGVSTWQAVVATRAKTEAVQSRAKAVAEQQAAERAQQAEKQARLRADKEKEQAAHNLYIANMHLAQNAWEENNISQLNQVLEGTKDSPFRSFEWYYWQRQAHLSLRKLWADPFTVFAVAYSPDGQRIVTAGAVGRVRIWDAATGRELLSFQAQDHVLSLGLSPDGLRIVTCSGQHGTAKVWEATSGKELMTLKGHGGYICSVALSRDGRRIITGSLDKTAKVWDAANGREILTLKGHTHWVLSVAFSPDGQKALTGSQDKSAKVWDVQEGRELLTLMPKDGPVGAVAFSPDGQRIITGTQGKAQFWEASSGYALFVLGGRTREASSIAFSLDGQRVVVGSWYGGAKVWQTGTGEELGNLASDGRITSVAFSPDGRTIATAGGKAAEIWQAPNVANPHLAGGSQLTLTGHTDSVFAIAFSPESRRLVTGSGDRTARVWDVSSGQELLTLTGHLSSVGPVAFSPDGRLIATGSDKVRLWDAVSGRALLSFDGQKDGSCPVAFSPDSQRIANGNKVWDLTSGRELLTFTAHSNPVVAVAFSPNGRMIATSSKDRTKLWDAATGRDLVTIKEDGFGSVAFSPDNKRILTRREETMKVWEIATGQELFTIKPNNNFFVQAVYSPDGKRIAACDSDGIVSLWDATGGEEVLTLWGGSAGGQSVAFSPDGRRIAIGGEDKSAKVWEAAAIKDVAAWQNEEQAAARVLNGLTREYEVRMKRKSTAVKQSAIPQWLVLAPIAIATNQAMEVGLDTEQVEGEGLIRPKQGESRSIGGIELKWQQVASEYRVIDFNVILGKETSHCVAYAVCYLRSETDQRGLQLHVQNDDQAKIYLNGKQIYRTTIPHTIFNSYEDQVTGIDLNAGLNVLVFKVVNESELWQGSIRLTDAQGEPVKGIQITLDPEAKEKAGIKKP